MQIENTYFELANAVEDRNVLVICDRGTMDASAFISKEQWDKILARFVIDPLGCLTVTANGNHYFDTCRPSVPTF